MQNLLAKKVISMTELREPAKVLALAGNDPVAILNRNEVVGYLVPVGALGKVEHRAATLDEVKASFKKRQPVIQPILDYLKDK